MSTIKFAYLSDYTNTNWWNILIVFKPCLQHTRACVQASERACVQANVRSPTNFFMAFQILQKGKWILISISSFSFICSQKVSKKQIEKKSLLIQYWAELKKERKTQATRTSFSYPHWTNVKVLQSTKKIKYTRGIVYTIITEKNGREWDFSGYFVIVRKIC